MDKLLYPTGLALGGCERVSLIAHSHKWKWVAYQFLISIKMRLDRGKNTPVHIQHSFVLSAAVSYGHSISAWVFHYLIVRKCSLPFLLCEPPLDTLHLLLPICDRREVVFIQQLNLFDIGEGRAVCLQAEASH